MYCKSFTQINKVDDNGEIKISADLVSSTTPETFPLTGEGITNLNAFHKLEPGTTIYVVDSASLYMMNEEYEYILQ